MKSSKDKLISLSRTLNLTPGDTVADRLMRARKAFAGRLVFTSSFGLEDQLITHHIATLGLDIDIVTLDTGRLFEETHSLWAATEARYGIRVTGFAPDPARLQFLLRDQGVNGFRASVEARLACCGIRKLEPLGRALHGAALWITGLRADQSKGRGHTEAYGVDVSHNLIKHNPLFDHNRALVVDAVEALNVPHNSLHDQGFVSIGCAPCTRAIEPGEDERAGRWWWEAEADEKECGLHLDASGQLVRAVKTIRPEVIS